MLFLTGGEKDSNIKPCVIMALTSSNLMTSAETKTADGKKVH